MAPSLFVDDEPYHFANLMLKDGEAHAFRLSDVATEAFFEGKETTIFLRLKERAPEQRL